MRARWTFDTIASVCQVSTAALRLVTIDERGVQLPARTRLPAMESESQLRAFLASLSGVDAVGAEARAAKLATRSLKKSTKLTALDLAISMVDLTTLEGADTPGRVTSLCVKAMYPDPHDASVPSAAAVCIYPDLVARARTVLGESRVKVASVATAFPSGRAMLNVKLLDVREAVAAGADEIDMVIDRGAFLSGRVGQVFEEIVAVKKVCGSSHLKVILETGELATYDNVRRASWIAMLAGADFIKTSTGKVTVSSTLPAALVMLEAVLFAERSLDAAAQTTSWRLRATRRVQRRLT